MALKEQDVYRVYGTEAVKAADLERAVLDEARNEIAARIGAESWEIGEQRAAWIAWDKLSEVQKQAFTASAEAKHAQGRSMSELEEQALVVKTEAERERAYEAGEYGPRGFEDMTIEERWLALDDYQREVRSEALSNESYEATFARLGHEADARALAEGRPTTNDVARAAEQRERSEIERERDEGLGL